MNVYFITAYGHYCGGVALVAAGSEDEAVELAGAINLQFLIVEYHRPEEIEKLPCTCIGPARVLKHFEYGE
jgi:hypothetical protein